MIKAMCTFLCLSEDFFEIPTWYLNNFFNSVLQIDNFSADKKHHRSAFGAAT